MMTTHPRFPETQHRTPLLKAVRNQILQTYTHSDTRPIVTRFSAIQSIKMSGRVNRVTMFRCPDKEQQKKLLVLYDELVKNQSKVCFFLSFKYQKQGKPYRGCSSGQSVLLL